MAQKTGFADCATSARTVSPGLCRSGSARTVEPTRQGLGRETASEALTKSTIRAFRAGRRLRQAVRRAWARQGKRQAACFLRDLACRRENPTELASRCGYVAARSVAIVMPAF